jgi:outer membrane protein assembly factor BamD (BamD/ComL family)
MKRMLGLILMLSVTIFSCSKKSDRDLYGEGNAAEAGLDFGRAASLYEEVAEKYPHTAYAESSLVRAASIYNNNLKDMPKALRTYRRFYESFPSSKQAPTMLFLSGFLLNNEMHMLDSARAVYEAFLQKYPDHELAPSARFELGTLGKDPNESLTLRIDSAGTARAPQKKTAKK